MYEWVHLAAAYAVGTAAGLALFRTWVKEQIITATLDTLIDGGYLKGEEDDEGTFHLTRIDDHIQDLLNELIQEEGNEEDDTP